MPRTTSMPAIPIDRLQPGMFISLESVGWMAHPFLLNRFRIDSARQIQALKRMGLTSVEWDPERSTSGPLPEDAGPAPVPAEEDLTAGALQAMMSSKRDRVLQVREKRETIARCARLFEQETGQIRQVLESVGARPNEAHKHGRVVVDRLVGSLVKANSVAVHLVNLKKPETGAPNHAMNVMVLSLLIGKTLGLAEDEMKQLGLGALLHDVGLADIPARVQRNQNRSAAEEQFYRAHTGYGLKLVAPMRDLPIAVKNVIACHHENWDGHGYPNGLAGTKIPKLARVVAIANRYDNLCNPLDPKLARPPGEAVAHMFKNENSGYDPEILGAFVKALGIYPPGTFVTLADGTYGLVIESNSRDLLRPLLMLYDASVPRSEALLLDVRESDEKIAGAVSPRDVPREVIEYLAPQGRVDFYLEGSN
jgi:HD-GYP domain-containing protein (c-di-GMP phosphodiesterase class II)